MPRTALLVCRFLARTRRSTADPAGLVDGLLPHVNPHVNGLMSGTVGASGNLGGIIFSVIFRFTAHPSYGSSLASAASTREPLADHPPTNSQGDLDYWSHINGDWSWDHDDPTYSGLAEAGGWVHEYVSEGRGGRRLDSICELPHLHYICSTSVGLA